MNALKTLNAKRIHPKRTHWDAKACNAAFVSGRQFSEITPQNPFVSGNGLI